MVLTLVSFTILKMSQIVILFIVAFFKTMNAAILLVLNLNILDCSMFHWFPLGLSYYSDLQTMAIM